MRSLLCATLLCLSTAAFAQGNAVTTPSGLIYQSLKDGTGASPAATDTVKVHYKGTFPDSGKEFDTSIKGAHVIPEKSAQLKGLNAQIVSATGMKAGEKPTVVFKLTNNDGSAVDGSKLTSFAPMIAGPTSSYSKYYREVLSMGCIDLDARTSAPLCRVRHEKAIPFTSVFVVPSPRH